MRTARPDVPERTMASETWVPAEAGRVQLTGVGGTSSQALAKETGASF